jgi:hypothetical protein
MLAIIYVEPQLYFGKYSCALCVALFLGIIVWILCL